MAVDAHGAGAADFFEAAGIPGDGGDLFAVGGGGVGGDVLQALMMFMLARMGTSNSFQ